MPANNPLAQVGSGTRALSSAGRTADRLLTPKEAADFLRVSLSWLAKARMRGDGPPYAKFGRCRSVPGEWAD